MIGFKRSGVPVSAISIIPAFPFPNYSPLPVSKISVSLLTVPVCFVCFCLTPPLSLSLDRASLSSRGLSSLQMLGRMGQFKVNDAHQVRIPLGDILLL